MSLSAATFWANIQRKPDGGSWLFELRFISGNGIEKIGPDWDCKSPKQGLSCGPMIESIYQYVLDELEAHKGTWPTIAEESGVNIATLKKIVYRTVENPGILHIEKLAKYFRDRAPA